jgi:hypothetical protein
MLPRRCGSVGRNTPGIAASCGRAICAQRSRSPHAPAPTSGARKGQVGVSTGRRAGGPALKPPPPGADSHATAELPGPNQGRHRRARRESRPARLRGTCSRAPPAIPLPPKESSRARETRPGPAAARSLLREEGVP